MFAREKIYVVYGLAPADKACRVVTERSRHV